MKTKFCILIFLLAAAFAPAQTNNLTSLLQQGLFEEQANRNLDAAISNYQSLATQFDKDRQIAATAVFRIGECYRMQGKTNEAVAQYQRILRDFSDQTTLATLSQQNLTGLGATVSKAASSENSGATLWDKVKNLQPSELEKVLPTLAPDAVLTSLLQQRNETEAKIAELNLDVGPQNPQIVDKRAVLDVINEQISDKIGGIMQALKMQFETSNAASSTSVMSPNGETTGDEDREIQRIQQMIQDSPDLINAPGEGGNTPLAAAATKGWLKVAGYLLDHGADVNAGGTPALNAAATVGNRAMVELLLSRGANVNSVERGGRTPLAIASEKNFPSVVEVLLANKADMNAPSGNPPLSRASVGGYAKIVAMLLAAGANPDAEDSSGVTPLGCAAGNGSSETVKLLLDAKADPNGGKVDAPLLCAICKQDAVSAELLLQAGANPNAAGGINMSLKDDTAYFLNQRGHLTPLWLAIYMNQLPMVNLLLKFKADPNDSQTCGLPLLFYALENPDILETLLDAGAKADVRDEIDILNNQVIKRTPLESAVDQNNADSVGILLKHGVNPNMQDARGDTALHWAAFQLADEKVFSLLLDFKADPNVRDNDGKTPLDLVKVGLQSNLWPNRFGNQPGQNFITAEQTNLVDRLVDLLHQHGALDKLPDWDRIIVSRLSANFSQTVFVKGTNDWNQFTLLEAILNFYEPEPPLPPSSVRTFQERLKQITAQAQGLAYYGGIAFPNLAQVVIVRHHSGTTNETRIKMNLLDSTNGIDCAKDVPLEFGDVVEIPERDHALGDMAVGLTPTQIESISDYLKGNVHLVAHGQNIELPIYPSAAGSELGSLMRKPEAQKVLLSSSDLSRVKVIRHDAKTGENHEWIVDCSEHQFSANGNVEINNNDVSSETIVIAAAPISNGNNPEPSSDLWLRDGDVIEVLEKP